MRFFLIGPRILGIRPGISLSSQSIWNHNHDSPRARHDDRAGHHKIGVSTDPIARLAQLQTGSPVPLRFAYIGATRSNGYNIEAAAHALLDAHRQEGEWFLVPASIAIGAASARARAALAWTPSAPRSPRI